MTYKQAAQSALDVQNACNVSGILKTLANEVMDALWSHANAHQLGTKWVNRHPIIALYLFKAGELNCFGIPSLDQGYEIAERDIKNIIDGYPERDYREGL